jgi:hypothetical protein
MVSAQEWLQRLREDEPVPGIASEEIVSLIDEERAERGEQILRAISDRD